MTKKQQFLFFLFINLSLLCKSVNACISTPSAASTGTVAASTANTANTAAATSTSTSCGCTFPLNIGDRGVAAEIQHGPFDWNAVAAQGFRFVDIGITQGLASGLPTGSTLLSDIKNAGLLAQPHHFGDPTQSDGATQARFFDANGGHFTCDGRSLPGALLIQEPIGTPVGTCPPGFSQAALVQWITDFYTTYRALNNGCGPTIYTDMLFWQQCTGNSNVLSSQFNANLQVANTDDPQLAGQTTLPDDRFKPFGWSRYAIWANQRLMNVGGITGSFANPSPVLGLIYNGLQNMMKNWKR